MAQPRNHQRIDRTVSIASATGGGVLGHPEYATQTLFDQVKEKKVHHNIILY